MHLALRFQCNKSQRGTLIGEHAADLKRTQVLTTSSWGATSGYHQSSARQDAVILWLNDDFPWV
jgi:hypothetical protein